MAWDPTFNWAVASSFNGEARKLSILDEILTQLNIKAVCTGETPISIPSHGGTVGMNTLNNYFLSVATQFYKDVTVDETRWTRALLETAIGSALPGRFSPTWINWMYQAINLIVYATDIEQYVVTLTPFTKTHCYEVGGVPDPTCPCAESDDDLKATVSHTFSSSYSISASPGTNVERILATYPSATYSACDEGDVYAVIEMRQYTFAGKWYSEVWTGIIAPRCDTIGYSFAFPQYRNYSSSGEGFWRSTQVLPLYRNFMCDTPSAPTTVTLTPVLPSC